jgi:cell division septum initiation protein DivIVA
MRALIPLAAAALAVALSPPLCAAGLDEKPPDQQSIDALQIKASQAQPREQCFLYALLVQEMTEYSLRQYAAGNVAKANDLLRQVQQLAQKIHRSAAADNKRLKNAEILLRRTAFRLNEMLHSSSSEDRPLVAETLAQVNQAENQAMLQVFRK